MKTLDGIRLEPNERAAIQAAAAVLRERLPITQVILFGSKARGDDCGESDIDLLLLTARSLTWEERDLALELLFSLQLEYEIVFGLMVVSEDDWYRGVYQVMPIRDEVERDGVAA